MKDVTGRENLNICGQTNELARTLLTEYSSESFMVDYQLLVTYNFNPETGNTWPNWIEWVSNSPIWCVHSQSDVCFPFGVSDLKKVLYGCDFTTYRQNGSIQHFATIPGSTASYDEHTQARIFEILAYLANWLQYTSENGFQCAPKHQDGPSLAFALQLWFDKTARTGSH